MSGAVVAIDTAGPVIGVALRVGADVSCRTERVARGAEERLVPWVLELCAEAGVRPKDLDAIGVAVGPGAFTGLRVGIATATGLALAAGVRVAQVGSLASRGAAIWRPGLDVLVLLDARKSRFYAQRFGADGSVGAAADVPVEAALAWMTPGQPFVATGEGARVAEAAIRVAGGEVATDAESPAVGAMAELTRQAWLAGDLIDAAAVRPRYLREADATPPPPAAPADPPVQAR